MKYLLLSIIMLGFASISYAGEGQYERYHINVRIEKPLPAFITNNLAAIQTSINKIKNVSRRINQNLSNEEDTNSFAIDNNASYLEVKATFAIPHPVPQQYLDEQAKFENFLTKLRENAMPSTEDYQMQMSKHVCNNGTGLNQPCVIAENF